MTPFLFTLLITAAPPDWRYLAFCVCNDWSVVAIQAQNYNDYEARRLVIEKALQTDRTCLHYPHITAFWKEGP